MESLCTVVTWMPHCLGFIVKSGSSPQGRNWEKKVRTLVCIHFFSSVPLLKTCVHQPWSFGEVLFCAENVILTLECINSVKLTQCGLKLFFYNIVEFLDMLVGHRFRNAALYHCKESVNYPELWFVTMSVFLLFLKIYNSLFIYRFNVFSKGFCTKLFK